MIVLLCGIPGSGKTTIAARAGRRLADGVAFERLSSDDFPRRPYDRMYERVADATGDEVRHWLLDGTFYRREWRNRFYRLDDTYEVWVRASLETCLERNRRRADPVPEQGVRAIHGRFEPPRADLEVDTEALGIDEAADRLVDAIRGWLAA